MVSAIEEKRSALEEICRRFHVARLEIFGSASTGEFNPGSSDLDFLVEFERNSEINLSDQYFGLWESLEGLFGCKVDLLTARSIRNPYFIKAVNQTRKVVYAA